MPAGDANEDYKLWAHAARFTMTLEQIAKKFTLSDADAEKAISEAQGSAGAPLSLDAEKRAVTEAARNKKLMTPDECTEFKAVDDADIDPIRDKISKTQNLTAPKDAILDSILSDFIQTAIEDSLGSPGESPAQNFQLILSSLSSPRALRNLGQTIIRLNTELSEKTPNDAPAVQPNQQQAPEEPSAQPEAVQPAQQQASEPPPVQPEAAQPVEPVVNETKAKKAKKAAPKKTPVDQNQLKAALDAQAQQLKTNFENEKAKLIAEFNQQKQQIIDGYKQELEAIKKSPNAEDTTAAERKALSDAQAELQSLKTTYGKQISDLQNTHSAQIQDLQNQLGSANSQNQILQERIDALQQENQAIRQQQEQPEAAAPTAAGNGEDDDLPLRRVSHVQERRENATGNAGTGDHQETADAGGNDHAQVEYTKPERMGVDTTAMDEWNQAVVTKFGFPFINFACRDITNLLNGDDVTRKRAYANIKDQLRQLAHLQTRGILGGMWDSMMESPIMLLKTLKSSSYSKCYLNTLIANGREVRDTPDGANLTVRPTIYGDVKFRVRKPEEIPINFVNKFFVEVDPYRQLGVYRKWTGNPNGTTPEAYLDDNAIPYTSVLAPTTKTSFSRSDLSTGSFLSRVTGFRKANSMVTCSIDGHRGGFIIPAHIADVLFAY